MTWEEREKKADIRVEVVNGLWVCFMVLSAVSCLHQLSYVGANVTGFSWVRGVTRLQDQWGHRQQMLAVFFFLKYVVLEAMDSPEKEKKKKNTVRDGQRLWQLSCCWAAKYRCASSVVSGDVCLGGCCVFSGCQSSSGVGASFGLLPCVSCFFFCLKMGGQAVKVGGRGPSVAQCPELATLGSVRCLRGSCAGMQEWGMGGISPTDRHVEWVTCSASPCFSGDVWPSVWKWLCPHWRSGCSRWWLLSGDVVSMYLPLPLAGQILVNASQTCQDHFVFTGRRYGLI